MITHEKFITHEMESQVECTSFLGSPQWPVQYALCILLIVYLLCTAVIEWVVCFLHFTFPSCFISGWRWPILGMPSTLLNFPRCGSWHTHFCSHSGCWNPALWVPCVLVWARCRDHLWGSSGCMHGEGNTTFIWLSTHHKISHT